jgi:hypothetical protein
MLRHQSWLQILVSLKGDLGLLVKAAVGQGSKATVRSASNSLAVGVRG